VTHSKEVSLESGLGYQCKNGCWQKKWWGQSLAIFLRYLHAHLGLLYNQLQWLKMSLF